MHLILPTVSKTKICPMWRDYPQTITLLPPNWSCCGTQLGVIGKQYITLFVQSPM